MVARRQRSEVLVCLVHSVAVRYELLDPEDAATFRFTRRRKSSPQELSAACRQLWHTPLAVIRTCN